MPLPAPLAPDVTVIKALLLTAVQAPFCVAVTATLPVLATAPTLVEVGSIEYVGVVPVTVRITGTVIAVVDL